MICAQREQAASSRGELIASKKWLTLDGNRQHRTDRPRPRCAEEIHRGRQAVKISTILDQIDLGSIALPEFQRGYVWNRDQVRQFMLSLYHRYPVGGLLVWVTKTETAEARGDDNLAPGSVKLLLDGQQRITSLYGIVRGTPPTFFEGNTKAFTGLHFNLKEESFEFYAPVKMKDDPLWLDVTSLMQSGTGEAIQNLLGTAEFEADLQTYINRLTTLGSITDIDLHIDEVTGEDKSVDVVVDIFNRVNSGGTKLSKGDLALAKICAEWPDARAEMNKRLLKWRRAGYNFRLEWLLRSINTLLTGEALFAALEGVDAKTFAAGLRDAESAIDSLLNMIAGRLGLDHDRVLGSRYSFPLMVRYLHTRGGHLSDQRARDELLYWYVHTFLWGRYAGSTETVLNQDLDVISEPDGALDRLTAQLRRGRGDLRLRPDDFLGWSKGARFYPLMYMLTRAWHARDWETGVELSSHLLGHLSQLEVHHIFPKALLRKHGYSRAEINAIANFTFLTKEANLLVSARDPAEYLAEFAGKAPGALESHWIPMDQRLWRAENYPEFLAARRDLLANAANQFLDSLAAGAEAEMPVTGSVLEREAAALPGGVASDEEERVIQECQAWVAQRGLPEGQYTWELADPDSGDAIAILDLAWPDGLQEGLSQPVALLIDEGEETIEAANRAGFRWFTDIDAFRAYVEAEILGEQ